MQAVQKTEISMTLYELIRLLLRREAEQTEPPFHMAAAVQETMRQKSCQKETRKTTEMQNE